MRIHHCCWHHGLTPWRKEYSGFLTGNVFLKGFHSLGNPMVGLMCKRTEGNLISILLFFHNVYIRNPSQKRRTISIKTQELCLLQSSAGWHFLKSTRLSYPMTWLRGKITCLALMLTVLTLKLGKHYLPILFRFFSFFFPFLSWTLQLYVTLIYEKDLPLADKVYVCKTIFIKFKHKLCLMC